MKKTYNKSKKNINSTHCGYVLYDRVLTEDSFVQNLNKVIQMHDVFNHVIEEKKVVVKPVEYEFGAIHSFDQISFVGEVDSLKNNEALTLPAEFKLIYFHNSLRGFYFRLNSIFFDDRSVKKLIHAIEKQQFNHKNKQSGTSYQRWIEQENKSFDDYFQKGQYQAKMRTLEIDDQLTKRIRAYLEQENTTLFQFMAGVIGTYYKVNKQKDLVFQTNLFDDQRIGIIGNLELPVSYAFKRKQNISLNDFIKNDYKQLEHPSNVKIHLENKYSDLIGHVRRLETEEIFRDIEFIIVENDWNIELKIVYQKYKHKKDDIFLMVNKLRMVIFHILENGDDVLQKVNLLTKKEEKIALTFSEPEYKTDLKSLYDNFVNMRLKTPDAVAVTDGSKEYTYLKISAQVAKLNKIIGKNIKQGDVVSIESDHAIDHLVTVLAIDHCAGVYSADHHQAKWLLKKSLFGFKITPCGDAAYRGAQYVKNGHYISTLGYQNYCNWFVKYFKLTAEDRVLVNGNVLDVGIPCIISGTPLVVGSCDEIDSKGITFAALTKDDMKPYSSLKGAIISSKTTEMQLDYNLFYGKKWSETVPYSMIGKLKEGRLQSLVPVQGLGLMLLNKDMKLTQAFEKGQVFVHGPGAQMSGSHHNVTTSGITMENASKIKDKGTWFLDESLRL